MTIFAIVIKRQYHETTEYICYHFDEYPILRRSDVALLTELIPSPIFRQSIQGGPFRIAAVGHIVRQLFCLLSETVS